MHIIVCVDDNGGMLFNKRRQSQDRILREHIMKDTWHAGLWMNAYSFRQFSDMETGHIIVDEAFMDKAGTGEFCFLEDVSAAAYEMRIERIIMYKWNRIYPSDFKFDISLEKNRWILKNWEEFTGSSHEKITKEVYER